MAGKIIQIVAAPPGWWSTAVADRRGYPEATATPVIVWALVEEDTGDRYVTAASLPAEGGRWRVKDLDGPDCDYEFDTSEHRQRTYTELLARWRGEERGHR
jgi:hypothetical protein